MCARQAQREHEAEKDGSHLEDLVRVDGLAAWVVVGQGGQWALSSVFFLGGESGGRRLRRAWCPRLPFLVRAVASTQGPAPPRPQCAWSRHGLRQCLHTKEHLTWLRRPAGGAYTIGAGLSAGASIEAPSELLARAALPFVRPFDDAGARRLLLCAYGLRALPQVPG